MSSILEPNGVLLYQSLSVQICHYLGREMHISALDKPVTKRQGLTAAVYVSQLIEFDGELKFPL